MVACARTGLSRVRVAVLDENPLAGGFGIDMPAARFFPPAIFRPEKG